MAVPLTHNLPKLEAEKIVKYEIGPGHKNIWKFNHISVYPLVISVEGVVIKNKISRAYRCNHKHPEEWGKKQCYYKCVTWYANS